MPNTPPPYNRFTQMTKDEFAKYLLTARKGNGPMYSFLLFSALVSLVFLITVLKPHRLYKRFIAFLFGIQIKVGTNQFKLHHFLYVFALFFGTVYIFTKLQQKQFLPNRLDDYHTKMNKLNNKWINESCSWLSFLTFICILAICRNSRLFSKETELEKKKNEVDKELQALQGGKKAS